MGKQAIIIGAGPAGLTAAYQLLKTTDIQPILLEELDDVGGISRTVAYKNNRMDLGGHRFFTKSKEVQDIWSALMPLQGSGAYDDIMLHRQKPYALNGPDPEKEDRVMLLRDRISRIYFKNAMFDYPLSINLSTIKNMGFASTFVAGMGYISSALMKKPEDNLENFMINRFGKPLYHAFFEDYTEKVWGRHPKQISASWGEQRIKGLNLKKALLNFFQKSSSKEKETSLIEQYYYPKKGPGQLWQTMLSEIEQMGGKIIKNCKAQRFAFTNNQITGVYASTLEGEQKFIGDYFFSSMPIKDLIPALQTNVPAEILQIAADLPYRDFITVGLLVKQLKLKNTTKYKTLSNITPDCWIYVQDRNVALGRLQIFNNWSPYMVEDVNHTVFVGLEYFCNEGDKLWRMDDSHFIQMAVEELERIGVIDRADILDATRIKVKKAYPAYFDSYDQIDKVIDYLNSIDNLYCIGRNGQHRYNNMDHSMLTALRAVDALQGKLPKTEIWNVNTEKTYHETK